MSIAQACGKTKVTRRRVWAYADKSPRKENGSHHGQCEHRHTVALGLQRYVCRQGACVLGSEMMHLQRRESVSTHSYVGITSASSLPG